MYIFFSLYLDISTHTSTLLNDTLKFLTDHDFIRERIQDKPTHTGDPLPLNREYYSTQLGLATVASALSPDDALVVFSEFLKARKAFVLENELHIIYLVCIYYLVLYMHPCIIVIVDQEMFEKEHTRCINLIFSNAHI